jgi:hypothetical protein
LPFVAAVVVHPLRRTVALVPGATRPWLAHSKTLPKSDVDENQNRLLVSCTRGSRTEDCPITRHHHSQAMLSFASLSFIIGGR